MTRYSFRFFFVLFGALAMLSGFNLFIDPYHTLDGPALDGVNARKTRAHEDGRRVLVSHQITRRAETSIVLGSSRVVDGFPETMPAWPGGLYNAGLRGSNAYELAFAAALAGQNKDLKCLIIGLDMSEFSGGDKYKSAFHISRFPDGHRMSSIGRMMLSPNTLARSVQTLRDNISGGSDSPPFKDRYQAGEQRRRFLAAPTKTYEASRSLVVAPDRIDFLFEAIETLAANGVQIIGYIHPVHAWNEEALFRAGHTETHLALRRELASRFDNLAKAYDPVDPCTPDADAVLWDFSGFQSFTTTDLPKEDQEITHPLFHEPAHYLPAVGLEMTRRMLGQDQSEPVPPGVFGVKLTPDNLAATALDISARRDAYLLTPEGQKLGELLIQAQTQAPEISVQAVQPVTQEERNKLRQLLGRIQPREH